MTSKDAMDGGRDPLQINPYLFDGDGPGREHSPSAMRTIAEEMRSGLDAMLGKGERPNGNINQISTGGELSTAQIGQWSDAQALALTIGSNNAGRKFAEVYQKFIDAFEQVVQAIEANAANHDRARRENEG